VRALSSRTVEIIEATLPAEVQADARGLLETECSKHALGCEDWSEEQMERIWFAALKLANGDFSRLKSAVDLAKADWRDLLMAAGFGANLNAHTIWSAHAC